MKSSFQNFAAHIVLLFMVLACAPVIIKRAVFESDEEMQHRLKLEKQGKWNGI